MQVGRRAIVTAVGDIVDSAIGTGTKPAQVNLEQRNIAVNASSKRSQSFNLAKEDKVPDLALNEVIWKFVKGENSVMPAPKRSAFVILEEKKKDDDD